VTSLAVVAVVGVDIHACWTAKGGIAFGAAAAANAVVAVAMWRVVALRSDLLGCVGVVEQSRPGWVGGGNDTVPAFPLRLLQPRTVSSDEFVLRAETIVVVPEQVVAHMTGV